MSKTAHTFGPLATCMIPQSDGSNLGASIAIRAIMTADDNKVIAEISKFAMPEYADLFAAAPDMLADHKENARILGFLVSELQGRVEGGKLGAIMACLDRSKSSIAKAEGRT